MASSTDTIRASVATGNQILDREGVLDAFGHVSVRNPEDPARFFLARSLAPELVTTDDVLEFDLSSELVRPSDVALYSERHLSGATQRQRRLSSSRAILAAVLSDRYE